jgi:hypothetical protein
MEMPASMVSTIRRVQASSSETKSSHLESQPRRVSRPSEVCSGVCRVSCVSCVSCGAPKCAVPRVVEGGEPALVLNAEVVADVLQLLLAVPHNVNIIDPQELQRAALSDAALEALHLGHCFTTTTTHHHHHVFEQRGRRRW